MNGLRPAAGLVVEVLDGEAVILALADGRVHRLNEVATRWWSDLVAGGPIGGPEDGAEVATLVAQLLAVGLVVRDDADAS